MYSIKINHNYCYLCEIINCSNYNTYTKKNKHLNLYGYKNNKHI